MSDKPETLSAILAEMRAAAKSTDLFNGEEVGEPLIRGTKVEEWADRIKAAAEREREAAQSSRDARDAMDYAATAARQAFVGVDLAKDKPTHTCVEIAPGNAAAMRAALENLIHRKCLVSGSCSKPIAEQCEHPSCVWYECRAALAAPARNCDVGTTEEQAERFIEFCKGHLCDHCPISLAKRCGIGWSQMPFEPAEGGAE